MKAIEDLDLELQVITPNDVTADQVRETLKAVTWEWTIDLTFDITCQRIRLSEAAEVERDADTITWAIEASATVLLTSHEPMPRDHYDADTTRGYIQVEPALLDGWEAIEVTVR